MLIHILASDIPTSVIVGDPKSLKETTVTTCMPTGATTTLTSSGLSHGGYSSGSGTLGSIAANNHLDVPQQSNPNLLSPDTLQSRRGMSFTYLDFF